MIVGEPEAAGEERALARRQPVARPRRVVAQHEAVLDQLALDRRDRADDARIVGRQEADQRDQQQARVQLLAP